MPPKTHRISDPLAHHGLLSLSPPYLRLEEGSPSFDGTVESGTVLVIDLGRAGAVDGKTQAMLAGLRKFRREHPPVLMASRASAEVTEREMSMRALMRTVGVRVHLPRGVNQNVLRQAVGRAGVLDIDVRVWLFHRFRPKGVAEHGLTSMLAEVVAGIDIDSESRRALGRWVKRVGLPKLYDWEVVGRLIRALTVLQANPDYRIGALSRQFDFANGSTFSHVCRRLLATTPTRIRKTVGWEWLLTSFLSRQGLGPNEE